MAAISTSRVSQRSALHVFDNLPQLHIPNAPTASRSQRPHPAMLTEKQRNRLEQRITGGCPDRVDYTIDSEPLRSLP